VIRGLEKGIEVICKHGHSILVDYNGKEEPCSVLLTVGDLQHTSQFTHPGHGKGGGCIRLAPVSFSVKRRTNKHSGMPKEQQKAIQEFYENELPTSPCTRDQVRRRLGSGFYQTLPALMMYMTFAMFYKSYVLALSTVPDKFGPVSFAQFKRCAPWNIRRGARETCICKQCKNYQGYPRAFRLLPDLLKEYVSNACSPTADGT
jgi:hypothetical protein